MKFTYLGTAAAEGWPAVYCNCDHCKRAKAAGGRNIRTRSQALVNDDLLIDYPADTYAHALANRLDLSAVRYLLFTHSHMDHCEPLDLAFRMESCYAHGMTCADLDIYGNEACKKRLENVMAVYHDEKANYNYTVVNPFEPFEFGSYKVTPLKAHHSSPSDLVYIIQSEGKTILYLHDTGTRIEESIDYLVSNKIKADLVSYDCTFVALPSSGGHMGLDTNVVMRDLFLEKGIIDTNTINVVNHFSHNGKLIYDELVPVARELGFETSYDGMVIEF